MQTAVDTLRAKARDYEIKSVSARERDGLEQEKGEFPSPEPMLWATVACVLYEVAEALEAERQAA